MPCTVTLNTRLASEDTSGYFVYLGYHASTQIDNSTNDASANAGAGDNGSNCWGIVDPFDPADVNDPYTQSPSVDIAITAHEGPPNGPLPYSQVVDFSGVTPGFYGFIYVTGDPTETGDLTTLDCGEVECFEIEVIEGPSNMTVCNNGANNPCETICEANIPDPGGLNRDLTTFFDAPVGFISGGTWTTIPIGTINGSNILNIPFGTPPGSYTFTYTIAPGDLTSIHGVDVTCADCSATIDIIIEITATQSAGVGSSLAVCN
jgi:hypothetical protein